MRNIKRSTLAAAAIVSISAVVLAACSTSGSSSDGSQSSSAAETSVSETSAGETSSGESSSAESSAPAQSSEAAGRGTVTAGFISPVTGFVATPAVPAEPILGFDEKAAVRAIFDPRMTAAAVGFTPGFSSGLDSASFSGPAVKPLPLVRQAQLDL